MYNKYEFDELIKNKQKELKYLKQENHLHYYYNSTKSLNLSNGCESCVSGRNYFVYVTKKCNLKCAHCPQCRFDCCTYNGNGPVENKIEEKRISTGNEILVDNIDMFPLLISGKKDDIKGIGYTGGEPFLVINKVLYLLDIVNKINSNIYQWIYSNGVYITEDKLRQLNDNNIKEIRLDWAAHNYNLSFFKIIELSKKYIDNVIIEIPMLYDNLIDNIFIPNIQKLKNMGINQINCIELLLNDYNKSRLNFNDNELVHCDDDIVFPYNSRFMTYKIMKYIEDNSIEMIVNDCNHNSRLSRNFNAKLLNT